MARLFDPIQFRDVELPNRIGISPMCEYSSTDGHISIWHPTHLGSRAVGGAGMVMAEASAVVPEGRISAQDLGIWDDAHVEGLAQLAAVIRANGSVPAIQIAHAGRKASTHCPWDGGKPLSEGEGAWQVVGPSAIPFSDAHQTPNALTIEQIQETTSAFAAAARRAREADFDIVEIHGAHGYLISSFLSATSNHREDAVRRFVREPGAISPRDVCGGAGGVAGRQAGVCADFVLRVGRWWMDNRRFGRAGEADERCRCRSDRLQLGWEQPASAGPEHTGISSRVCRSNPARG